MGKRVKIKEMLNLILEGSKIKINVLEKCVGVLLSGSVSSNSLWLVVLQGVRITKETDVELI